MKAKELKQIELTEEAFKRVKKKKKCIFISTNNECKKLKANEKIIVCYEKKSIKRKINTIICKNTLFELENTLGKKKKYTFKSSLEENSNDYYAIEFYYSLKIFRKLFLLILLILCLFFGHLYLGKFINNYQVQKLSQKISAVKNNKVSYAIIEINPKIVVELVGNKITNSSCLNEDCQLLLNNIKLENMELKDAIITLYNGAKENNMNVQNGVKVYSSSIEIEDKISSLDYVKYETISKEKENTFLDQIIDNKNMKEQKNLLKYNEQLLKIYKKDSDYGKLYECSIQNKELCCYITKDFENDLSTEFIIVNFNEILNNLQKLTHVLNKFNIEYNTIEHYGIEDIVAIYVNDSFKDLAIGFSSSICDFNGCTTKKYEMPLLYLNDESNIFLPLSKLNLVNDSYNENDLTIIE